MIFGFDIKFISIQSIDYAQEDIFPSGEIFRSVVDNV